VLQRLVRKLGLGDVVRLLPPVDRSRMADLFRACQVLVSPSTEDGTPNSLLEGMACGAFPVAGDLPSVREWIEPGRNGLLFDPRDPEALSACLIRVLEDGALRAGAREANQALIDRDASYPSVMTRAEAYYRSVGGRPAAA
ncbi:MAG: glycosyltransferase, partial [Gemmatimonadales bacterium]